MASTGGQHIEEIGHTPHGNRVTLERESRVEGPGPHVFVYDKEETDTGFRSQAGKRLSRLQRILSAAKKVTVGLPNEKLSAARHPHRLR